MGQNIRGQMMGVDVGMFVTDDLSEIPMLARGIPLVMVSIDINKHTQNEVAELLRRLRRESTGKQYVFLSMVGFDDDPRELYNIPEVKSWTETFICTEMDSLAGLADERECQHPDAPLALKYTSDGAIGRAKMCVLAGLGKNELKNDGSGGHWIRLDESALCLLDSLGVKAGNA